MEQATANSPASGVTDSGAFPIEQVRAQFPTLEREVNGVPLDYLDSGASSQRVLASIEAPDLDQQLAQAKATLASAKANYDIASLTAGRYSTLVQKQAISQHGARREVRSTA